LSAAFPEGGFKLAGHAGLQTTDLLCTAWIRKGTYFAKEDDQHPECVLSNPPLPSPAPEILDYLARHPEAQDTLDGILHWWVLDSCVKRWAPRIAETVAKLVEQGFLKEKRSPDGQTFYHVSPRYLSTLQQQPTQPSIPTEVE
jgi:hypothetical protein